MDKIDLSDWGRVYGLEVIAVRGRTFGAALSWADEFVYVHSLDGDRIEPGDWSLDDFIF